MMGRLHSLLLLLARCNNVNDCGDNSDEKDCGILRVNSFYTHTLLFLLILHSYTPFLLILHSCTLFVLILDLYTHFILIVGVHDRHTSCSSDDFTCDSGHCVPLSTKCNDYYDCVDGSDEDNCGIL